jgi:hypothetical protein
MTPRRKLIARVAIVVVALVTAAAVVATLLSDPAADSMATLTTTRKAILIVAFCTAIVPLGIASTLRHSRALVTTAVGSVLVILTTSVVVFLT